MKKRMMSVLALTMMMAAAGCGSSPKRIEPGGKDAVTTVGQIDIRDFDNAAQEMTENLLASGVLDQSAVQPAVMAISRIVNNTTQRIDTDLLTKNIRVRLNKSGRVMTTTAIGLGGVAEDPMAKGAKQQQEFFDDKPKAGPDFNYSLSGKIIEVRARDDRTREVSFVFQLSLTDTRGLAVWEDQKTISKQMTRNALDF